MSWVMLGWAWPRWSAICGADRPASSSRVATVLRNVWLDTQGKPASLSALRRSAAVLDESRTRPIGLGKIATSVSRQLLRSNDDSYAAIVKHESESTFMAMHTSPERAAMWGEVEPLLEDRPEPAFFQVVEEARV